MIKLLSLIFIVCLCTLTTQHSLGYNPNADYQEKWGYIDVRSGAHMFWWLMHKTDTSRPLVVWLQGGPGASSTGFGNFQEIGPLDENQNARTTTWLNRADLIFIDNPVGTGYSYVDGSAEYTRNIDEIAADLLSWSKQWFTANPEYQTRPFYILCESYGGKMTAAWADVLYKAMKSGEVSVNFKGIGLGDSWISPMDYVNTWTPYLNSFSLLGNESVSQLNDQANQCQNYVDRGQWEYATNCWGTMERVLEQATDTVSFYNVLKRADSDPWSQPTKMIERLFRHHVMGHRTTKSLDGLMNGAIKQKLGIPSQVTWGGQSGQVFSKQGGDFMKPVITTVDSLIQNTDLKIFVFNGQLDLICCTLGTMQWVNRLAWPELSTFHRASRTAVRQTDGQTGMFYKSHKNFSFYWILRGGHMVAHDTPDMVDKMLQQLFS